MIDEPVLHYSFRDLARQVSVHCYEPVDFDGIVRVRVFAEHKQQISDDLTALERIQIPCSIISPRWISVFGPGLAQADVRRSTSCRSFRLQLPVHSHRSYMQI